MARNSVFNRFGDAQRSGFPPARLRHGAILGAVLTLGALQSPDALGSGIFRDLSAKDRSQPILVSATGDEIAIPSPRDSGSALTTGKIPAYLAFPLEGGEHLPAHTPTIATGPQPGQDAIGPLDLTSTAQERLNADLVSSRGVIVNTPSGSFAVAMLPRYARALATAASSTNSGDNATSVITSMFGLTPNANWTILGVSTKELSQWYKAGTDEISHLTSAGVTRVSKSLRVKVTPTNEGLNVAAEELIAPSSSNTVTGTAPIPTPEPASWLLFGLILGAAGLRRRAGLRHSPH